MSCARWKERKVVEARLGVLFLGGSVCLCGVGGPSLQEMELDVVKDVPPGPGGEQPYELLAWLNDTLQTSFTRVEQVCTGECQHTLMVVPPCLTLCYSTLAYFGSVLLENKEHYEAVDPWALSTIHGHPLALASVRYRNF